MIGLEPPYREIWDLLKHNQLIPFLGAGASLSGRTPEMVWNEERPECVPSGAELGQHLASLVGFPSGESTDDLAKVAEFYEVVVGPRRLRERLHRVFAGEYPYAAIHELLSEAPGPILMVTTNYDDMLERAFRAKGRAYHVVIQLIDNVEWAGSVAHWKPDAAKPDFVPPNKLRIDLSQEAVIYKMHGAVDRLDPSRDDYLITERHYVTFLGRMTNRTSIPAIFLERFSMCNFLFLGYRLNDWNLRVTLAKISEEWARAGEEALPSWAILRNPSLLEQILWEKRGVRIFNLAIQEFVEQLRRRQV